MTDPMTIQHLPIRDSLDLLLAGALGALAKDCIVDNTLELPFVHDKKMYLGFIGGALVGAFIGYVVDGSFFTALMGGYTGSAILKSLLVNGSSIKEEKEQADVEEYRTLNRSKNCSKSEKPELLIGTEKTDAPDVQ
jgi:hypothetical protein